MWTFIKTAWKFAKPFIIEGICVVVAKIANYIASKACAAFA